MLNGAKQESECLAARIDTTMLKPITNAALLETRACKGDLNAP